MKKESKNYLIKNLLLILSKILPILGRLLFIISSIIWIIVGSISGFAINMIYWAILVPITWIITGTIDCLPDFNIVKWLYIPLDYLSKLCKVKIQKLETTEDLLL